MYGDEQNREFVTASRKKLGFYPQKLFLESVGECLKLSMEDLMGIQMDSNKNISLIAKVLPEVSEQVIIFMLDKDWKYTGLDEYVGASYHIEKAADEAYASIRKVESDQ